MRIIKINSIRNKLIISLIGICVIPLIILGYSSYIKSKSMLEEKLKVTSQQTLLQVNNELDKYLTTFGNMISALATNYNIVNSNDSEKESNVLRWLQNLNESNKDIYSSYMGYTTGKYEVYPSNKTSERDDPRGKEWYKQALEHKGDVIITLPFKDTKTGKSIVSMARAVEKNGKIIGVCGMDVSLDTLLDKINMMRIGNTGYVFMSDAEGKVMIAHPQKELVGTDEASKLSFWNSIDASESGFINYNNNDVKKFGVYETNGTTGWKLVAELDEKEVTNDTNSIITSTLSIILIISLIATFLALILSKSIGQNIKNLKDVFEKASNGDLTVSIKASTKDEFMDLTYSFNTMMVKLSELMNSITKSSREVLETSSNLASMSEEVTASIGEVAKAIEEVSKDASNQSQNAQSGVLEMNQLSSRLDKINVDSNEMDILSTNTKELGIKGLSMIDALIEKSNRTKIATTEVDDIVRDMNGSTKRINTISETISRITEQTNLLSLNASIESARAGEAGKGFAVVAEEIRKLAEQSKESTNEIKKIIESIQKKSDTAVEAIKFTENVVNEQDTAVGEAQEIFKKILESIEIIIDKVEEVRLSINDINGKKKVVITEIENISLIAEETASASEEVTASTEEITAAMDKFAKYADELQLLAEKLDSKLARFKFD
ncbi:methyl-accepting chemotaxis protein [Clostridium beijerinckii]|uniref:methyl-accepting chemotaxis protein n=1 Tax=Clostridium beijerinckii TaxID=1520 RepID=UPI000A9D1262|nr:methyl-accepting chemotaxis protein [Clostridium beijerinckii]